ncbi:MAG: hypothetical protein LIP16_21555 [Clostridium sp.]|nr:hypothetical protein [Clostridium sp.]
MSERIKNAFDGIYAEEQLKTHTRDFLRQKLYERKRGRACLLKYAAAVCCMAALLGVGGHHFYFTPVSYISIDVNPSLEFGLNRMDRVISVTPYNEDGTAAVKNLGLKNLRYDDAIVTLLGSEEMSGYLTPDARISISVVSGNEDKNAKIQERVMECTGNRYGAVSCHAGSGEDIKNAHHAGLSFGKYQAFRKLQSLDPLVTAEDVRGLSMSQIQDLIGEYTGEPRDGDSSNPEASRDGDACNPETSRDGDACNPGESGGCGHKGHGGGRTGHY